MLRKIVLLSLVAGAVLVMGQNSQPEAPRPQTPIVKVSPKEGVEDALFEILNMGYYRRIAPRPLADEMSKFPRLREHLGRLVGFLSHPDQRVRKAAFDVLTRIQPDLPGGIDAPDLWRKWLGQLEKSIGFSPEDNRWIAMGWQSDEEIFSDIIHIRASYWSGLSKTLRDEPEKLSAVRRLVGYLRHPDRQIRVAAHDTLIRIQTDQPAGSDTPKKWEDWLKQQ